MLMNKFGIQYWGEILETSLEQNRHINDTVV